MSSLPLSLHPPYALPHSSTASDVSPMTPSPFAVRGVRLLPYVPSDVRVSAVTASIDEPSEAPLVSGVRLMTPMHTGAVSEVEELLPSIDQFLVESPAADGATTMAALFATPDSDLENAAERAIERVPGSTLEHVPEATPGDAAVDAAAPYTEAAVEPTAEPWAIADASEAVAELVEGLAARVPPAEAGTGDTEPASLEPWTDDEHWMDIMPALPTPGGPDLAAETAWARAFAEPPAPLPAGDTAAAAASLESIARRLRAGELELPGFRGDCGDAAALAAALAALLGARR